jgi:hypothetical protein
MDLAKNPSPASHKPPTLTTTTTTTLSGKNAFYASNHM